MSAALCIIHVACFTATYLQGDVAQYKAKRSQDLGDKAGDKEETGNSRLEEERKEKEQRKDDEVSNKILSLKALHEGLWGSSDADEDSDEELWDSSDEDEDSDEDLWGSSDEEEDSDEEAEDSASSEEEEESDMEAEDGDEAAEEHRSGKEQESDTVIGGNGHFAHLKVCSPLHSASPVLFQNSTVLEYVWHCCQEPQFDS